jgi:excisionase family DNA binding protein
LKSPTATLPVESVTMDEQDNVLTVAELADYLKVHPTTIYRLLKRRQVPAFKVGSDWRFNREHIDEWRKSIERMSAAGETRENGGGGTEEK